MKYFFKTANYTKFELYKFEFYELSIHGRRSAMLVIECKKKMMDATTTVIDLDVKCLPKNLALQVKSQAL